MKISHVLAGAAKKLESPNDSDEHVLGEPALEFFLDFIGTRSGYLWGLERDPAEIATWLSAASEYAKMLGR